MIKYIFYEILNIHRIVNLLKILIHDILYRRFDRLYIYNKIIYVLFYILLRSQLIETYLLSFVIPSLY